MMVPQWLKKAIAGNRAVKELNRNRGPLPYTSLIEEALVISASYCQRPRPILVIKQNLYNAQLLYERISSFLSESECALFSADESLRVEAIASSPEQTAVKVDTLSSLLKNPDQVVITCPSALLRHLPKPSLFKEGCIHLSVDDEMNMEELKRILIRSGYQETSHIDQPLCFAARGGIVDVYSINYEYPLRIEFFDTIIESIRYFDITTQKTIERINEADIVPASDILFSDEDIRVLHEKAEELCKGDLPYQVESDLMSIDAHVIERTMYPYMALLDETAGIWDYMEHPQVIWCEEEKIHENVKRLQKETIAYIQEMVQEDKLLPKYSVFHEYERIAPDSKMIYEDSFASGLSSIEEVFIPNEPLDIKLKLINLSETNILALSSKEMLRVKNALEESEIPYHTIDNDEDAEIGINLFTASYVQGFSFKETKVNVYTSAELFEVRHHKGRYENKFRNAEVIHGYEELEPGDFIVHATYGVGQYAGIENREIQGVKRDFLRCIYKGNAELLVPLEQFRLVRKFVSREGVVPRLNKLGTKDWEKTKKKLKENVDDIAERLLSLYADREEHIGHAFSKDTELSEKFDNEFAYELTEDQKRAIRDIKEDMESSKPMDRLVCGDVGFGKTEVAVQASFKAVSDNMQTAVLCPTTILAEQHYHTFSERYKSYPVTIRLLNRFVTPQQVKETICDVKDGKVDILIGTHRILSNDVKFKNLGLLIVDEEQRFGVEHKEKIKEMKTNVDVLTLSATPIPRTLQMSLVGIRSLSQLETPPMNRYSVQTYVVEKNNDLITDVIQRELARNGQVFYLFNNVERIYNTARTINNLVPEARVAVVHGQMNREEIEENMFRFSRHETDILVCTTIIENGIDIPNVNTIIVENAQNFGLSQIYQIKGRVGRSDRLAYAYLLIPPGRELSEEAEKRLQAVKEFARLGSGYKIAMRDLTIRGAGDLLGASQSGFIDTVGIDMYIEMLEKAIEEKKTGIPVEEKEVTHAANIKKTSYIPETFAPDDFDKLSMYQKIDSIDSLNGLVTYREEVEDQYGRLPKEVEMLFTKKQLDIVQDNIYVEAYRELKDHNEVVFSELFSNRIDGAVLFEHFTKISKDITLRYINQRITAVIPKNKDDLKIAVQVIESALEDMKDEN